MIPIGVVVSISIFGITSLVGALAWCWKLHSQVNEDKVRITKLEELGVENGKKIHELRTESLQMLTVAAGLDAKIEHKINEANEGMKELIREVRETLVEVTVTMRFLSKVIQELKDKSKE